MKVAVTGGTGLAGRFIVEALLGAGHRPQVLSRNKPSEAFFSRPVPWTAYALDEAPPDLRGVDALIHGAFAHLPGRYRGGEGDDPEGFQRRNLLGSQRIIEAAGALGCRVIFLSSRAVYGSYPAGTVLRETTPAHPDTLYGSVKQAVERTVATTGGVSLRATGVFGPAGRGQAHKWSDLFASFATGEPIAPRKATEVHGADLASACLIAVTRDTPPVLNVSDLMLDRRDLLRAWSEISGQAGRLPEAAEGPGPAAMDCSALRALGWQPRGLAGLQAALEEIAQTGRVITP